MSLTDQTVAPTIPNNLAQENTLDEGGQAHLRAVPLGSIRCRPTRTATLAPLHGGGRQHRSSRLAEPIDDRTEKGIDVVGYREDRSSRSASELEEVQTEMDDDRYAHSNLQVN